jgi:hypothetical protein
MRGRTPLAATLIVIIDRQVQDEVRMTYQSSIAPVSDISLDESSGARKAGLNRTV